MYGGDCRTVGIPIPISKCCVAALFDTGRSYRKMGLRFRLLPLVPKRLQNRLYHLLIGLHLSSLDHTQITLNQPAH